MHSLEGVMPFSAGIYQQCRISVVRHTRSVSITGQPSHFGRDMTSGERGHISRTKSHIYRKFSGVVQKVKRQLNQISDHWREKATRRKEKRPVDGNPHVRARLNYPVQ